MNHLVLILLLTMTAFLSGIPNSILAEQPPANSKLLFLGTSSSRYEECFKEIYQNNSFLSLNITTSHYDTTNTLRSFYTGRNAATAKNGLLNKLDEGYDYIILLPVESYIQDKPELHMEVARLIKSYTRSMGTKVIIPMLWDGAEAETYTAIFAEHTYRICDALGLSCVPAGLSWQSVLEDASMSVEQSLPNYPSNHAEYTLATTLYVHFFEEMPDPSTYMHETLSLAEQEAIANHSYTAWEQAKSTIHYTGEYTQSFCTPWAVPHDLGNRKWASMGTSTEKGTKSKLETLIQRAGYAETGGVHMNGYNYDNLNSWTYRYFALNLEHPDAQALVTENNYDFAFGRTVSSSTNFTSKMDKLHTYDPDEGGDTQFIIFNKHFAEDPISTVRNTYYWTNITALAARNHPDVQGIPNYIGLARAWHERPELELIRTNNQHLSNAGSFLQAGMIYTLITGQNPTSNYSKWSADELYVLHLAYKTVVELGGLKNVITPPIAWGNQFIAEAETPTSISFDAIDLDALPLTITITSGPSNGTLSGTGFNRTYTPDPGFTGTDSITYQVSNGTYSSKKVKIKIDVSIFPALVWERGKLTDVDNANWKTVNLQNTYNSMVVVATPIYDKTSEPIVTRIRNASGNSFELMAQTANGSTDLVPGIGVEYLVIEEGVYYPTIHGVNMEAVTYNSTRSDSKDDWQGTEQTYQNTYLNPVVFGQVMSYNDPQFSYFWSRGSNVSNPPSSTVLYTGKAVGQDTNITRADETVGYIVIEAGSGILPGNVEYTAALGGTSVLGMGDEPPYIYTYNTFLYPSGALISQAGMKGVDGSWAVLYQGDKPYDTSLDLAVDEDVIGDSERGHAAEQISYLLLSSSKDASDHVPGTPYEDMDKNSIPDLVQFSAGGDFQNNAFNQPFSLASFIESDDSKTYDFNIYRRQNLDFFNLAQTVLISFDLETWYDIESPDFPFTDITMSLSTEQTQQTSASPTGDVDELRYSINVPSYYDSLFFKLKVD